MLNATFIQNVRCEKILEPTTKDTTVESVGVAPDAKRCQNFCRLSCKLTFLHCKVILALTIEGRARRCLHPKDNGCVYIRQ